MGDISQGTLLSGRNTVASGAKPSALRFLLALAGHTGSRHSGCPSGPLEEHNLKLIHLMRREGKPCAGFTGTFPVNQLIQVTYWATTSYPPDILYRFPHNLVSRGSLPRIPRMRNCLIRVYCPGNHSYYPMYLY